MLLLMMLVLVLFFHRGLLPVKVRFKLANLEDAQAGEASSQTSSQKKKKLNYPFNQLP